MPLDTSPPKATHASAAFTRAERRATLALAFIYMLRLLGLFLLLPVFALEARHYPGGDSTALVGLAFGIYGLVQACMHIPLGWASDRWGRKRVIALGLLVFMVSSLWAAQAHTVQQLVWARAFQGLGAVSAATSALLADVTREVVRTKAMAVVGASIGLAFALSLVVAPPLAAWIHLSGIFWCMAGLAILGCGVLYTMVPHPSASRAGNTVPMADGLRQVVQDARLVRLFLGVLVLHAVQASLWLVVPDWLVHLGLDKAAHWQMYLPVVVLSVLLVGGVVLRLDRLGYAQQLLLLALTLLFMAQLGLLLGIQQQTLASLAGVLLLFFMGFNTLEALQPSLVSRHAPATLRGLSMGVYNTAQSMGLFVGGAAGGWLMVHEGVRGLLWTNMFLLLLWWLACWPGKATKKTAP